MKIIIRIIAVIFLIGGMMGLIKGVFPDLEWLSFRSLLGAGLVGHGASMLLIERVYGIMMAALEVLMAVLLLISVTGYIKLAMAVVCVNALGCLAAVIMGDLFAIVSLTLRITVFLMLVCVAWRERQSDSRTQDAMKGVIQ